MLCRSLTGMERFATIKEREPERGADSMTTMLLISVMLTAGLLKENQPVQMPVQVSFPS